MKPMIYKNTLNREREILAEGVYGGYRYWIISYGTHPCAYVELHKTHPYYGKENCDAFELDLDIHGGITFGDSELRGIIKDTSILGWDYNHCTDYNGSIAKYGKKWTTEEILEDVKSCINQLTVVELNNDNAR
jgi:hypothetical protein